MKRLRTGTSFGNRAFAGRQGLPDHGSAQRRTERGQSLAELALLLPLLLVLVLGAVDFGRLYYNYVTVTNAARTGAQYASASSANATNQVGITAAVLQETTSLQTNPTVTATTGNDTSGKLYTRVKVRHTFSPLFRWPGLPSSIAVERTVQMRVAQ